MDRKEFITTTGFSVLALGMFPLPALSAFTQGYQRISLAPTEHIRHGLLSPLESEVQHLVFQKNRFSQGLSGSDAAADLEVLSIMYRSENGLECLQLSSTEQEVQLVSSMGTTSFKPTDNQWQVLHEDRTLRIELYQAKEAAKIRKTNAACEQVSFISMQGSVAVGTEQVDSENGLRLRHSQSKLRFGTNNCRLLCVTQKQ